MLFVSRSVAAQKLYDNVFITAISVQTAVEQPCSIKNFTAQILRLLSDLSRLLT